MKQLNIVYLQIIINHKLNKRIIVYCINKHSSEISKMYRFFTECVGITVE